MGKDDKVPVETAIYDYMKAQNRPYSAGDIFSNLHKAHGKTAIVKALEQLANAKKLVEKAYGKSKIYVINQDEFPDVNDSDIQQIEKDITSLSGKCEVSQSELKKVKSELRSSLSTLTTEDARGQIELLKTEIENLKSRLDGARKFTNDISEEERQNIHKKHKYSVTQWRKRKRFTTDLMEAVLEGYPKSKKIFIEEVGIETDEEFGLTIPTT